MRPRPVSTLLVAVAGAALAPSLADAAFGPLEQFNRATGTAGAYGLSDPAGGQRIGGVTDNGRYVFFSLQRSDLSPDDWLKDAAPGEGLWVRDTLLNRTTRLSSDGAAAVTGIDRTQHIVSIVTSEGLSSADKNGKPDLYAYEPLTGIKLLISRTGHTGPATGITSFGTVTRGSTTAVYGTAAGIQRRELLTGRTTKIGIGSFLAPLDENGRLPYTFPVTADQYASNDGRTVVSDAGVITPTGVQPLPEGEFGETSKPFVNEAGTRLIWQERSNDLSSINVKTLPGGAVTSPEIPEALSSRAGTIVRPTPDGTGVHVQHIEFGGPAGYTITSKKWNLATGATNDLANLVFLSRNEKFGITGSNAGAYLVGPTPGNSLPGGVDLPAATAYVRIADQCGYDPETDSYDKREITVFPEWVEPLPTATSVRFQASTGPNAPVTVDKTVGVPTGYGYDPEKIVALPSADGAFRLDITVTLADGRKITQRVDHVARPADC